jgi:hypothetical protein
LKKNAINKALDVKNEKRSAEIYTERTMRKLGVLIEFIYYSEVKKETRERFNEIEMETKNVFIMNLNEEQEFKVNWYRKYENQFQLILELSKKNDLRNEIMKIIGKSGKDKVVRFQIRFKAKRKKHREKEDFPEIPPIESKLEKFRKSKSSYKEKIMNEKKEKIH